MKNVFRNSGPSRATEIGFMCNSTIIFAPEKSLSFMIWLFFFFSQHAHESRVTQVIVAWGDVLVGLDWLIHACFIYKVYVFCKYVYDYFFF